MSALAIRPAARDVIGRKGDAVMSAPTSIPMDIDRHAALPFPRSLPEFQRLFPNDAACAEYLEKLRWRGGFVCPRCGVTGEPFHNGDSWCHPECRGARLFLASACKPRTRDHGVSTSYAML